LKLAAGGYGGRNSIITRTARCWNEEKAADENLTHLALSAFTSR